MCMKNRLGILLLLLLFASGCLHSQGQGQSFTLSGTVVDESHEVIRGARVRLGNQVFVTDTEGKFLFTNLVQNTYVLFVDSSGYASYHEEIAVAENLVNLSIQLSALHPEASPINSDSLWALDGITMTFDSEMATTTIVPYPARYLNETVLMDALDLLLVLDRSSEVFFYTESTLSDVTIQVTIKKEELLREHGTILAIKDKEGNQISLMSLVSDLEELLLQEGDTYTFSLPLAQYIVPQRESYPPFRAPENHEELFMLSFSWFEVNWEIVDRAVLGYLQDRSDAFNFMEQAHRGTSQDKTAIFYIHGWSSEGKNKWVDHYQRSSALGYDIYTFDYFSNSPSRISGRSFAQMIQDKWDKQHYETIYMIAHSLGGIVLHEALYHAHNYELPFLNHVEKAITLGSPLGGVGSAITQVASHYWAGNPVLLFEIVSTRLQDEPTLTAILLAAVNASLRRQSVFPNLEYGVSDQIRQAKLFETYDIELYLLAGTNHYFNKGVIENWVIDSMVDILWWMVSRINTDYRENDGLVVVSSAHNQGEATEKVLVDYNHFEIAGAPNGAYDQVIHWLTN